MTSPARKWLTEQEYLAIERAAETKSQFFAGEMFAMAGASLAHNLITANVMRELGIQLRQSRCRVVGSDMRVKVSETGLYTYPDVVVVCKEPQLEDARGDTLLNPTLIIEVLSPSTEGYDRGEKFKQFRTIAALQGYILIAQFRPQVERYVRQPGQGQWVLNEISQPDGQISLAAIGCELSLSEIYAKVPFPEDENPLRPWVGAR
jgi:Uma2 family endonuclease